MTDYLLYIADENNNPMFEVLDNGDVRVKGKLIGNDEEIMEGLRIVCKKIAEAADETDAHVDDKELLRLKETQKWANAMMAAGVDNWDGYEDALDMIEE